MTYVMYYYNKFSNRSTVTMIQKIVSYVRNGCVEIKHQNVPFPPRCPTDITLSSSDMDNTFDSYCTKGQLC